jgi:hypothetical protein
MISDVLFEAIEEIERYQREFPRSYDEIKPDIEAVKAKMRALQRFLDTLPLA